MSDIQRILVFLAAVDHTSFRKAATHLNLSQPAVTKSIRRLEEDLGVNLFDRVNKKVFLTPVGKILVDRCREIARQYQGMIREVNLLAELEVGDILLGVGPFVAETILGPAIGRLLRSHPKLRISVRVDTWHELSELLIRGEIDLYVADIENLPNRDNVRMIEITQEPCVWCCEANHPILLKKEIKLSDLMTYPVVGSRLPGRLIEAFGRAGFSENALAISSPHTSLLLEIVRGGNAITLFPESYERPWIERGDIRTLPIIDCPFETKYGIVVLKDRTLPFATGALIEELKTMGKHGRQWVDLGQNRR